MSPDLLRTADPTAAPGPRVPCAASHHPDVTSGGDEAACHPVERALRAWLREQRAAQRPIALLRGTLAPPEPPDSSDLDVLCRPSDLAATLAALRRCAAAHGVQVISEHRAGFLVQLHLCGTDAAHRQRHLCVDLHTAEACRGVPFLSADELLRRAHEVAGLPRLRELDSALIDFLGPYLAGGRVHPRYLGPVSEAARRAPEFADLCTGLLGPQCAQALLRALADASHAALTALTALAALAPRVRRALLARAFLRGPWSSALACARFFVGVRVTPLWRPRGLVVAVLGTDGTGKSTLIAALTEALGPAYRAAESRVLKLRPGLLPQLDRVVHRRATYGEEDCKSPHRAEPSGRLGTLARAAWYTLDYVLGWALRVHPLRRRSVLLVFDRYVDDWLVDPLRFRMRPDSAVVRWLARLAPRPDVTLVCTASLATVRARKQELSHEESARQLAAYEALARSRADMRLVSTEGGVEATLARALAALFPGPEGHA